MLDNKTVYVVPFEELDSGDVSRVGGKNASLGEMIQALASSGIRVPGGFATTAKGYWEFLDYNHLRSEIESRLEELRSGSVRLAETGETIRSAIRGGDFPPAFREEILTAYRDLSDSYHVEDVDVAVRSSATAEDLPTASFAGQQETYLNVSGESELIDACRNCLASLFTDRAIAYRTEQGFEHLEVALSVGVQKMVRSDRAGAGVLFTLEPESGFPEVVVIDAAWGLGETVVQGTVDPDEYTVFKPLLNRNGTPILEKTIGRKEQKMVYAPGGADGEVTRLVETSPEERNSTVLQDEEIITLARWALDIENHYDRPMDIEWAKDGTSGDLYIVQARPETVQSQRSPETFRSYRLRESSEPILSGLSIGQAITSGNVCRIESSRDMNQFTEGSVLVTEMTQPDWVPIMKQAAGIITDDGGRTCHAAIVSRELEIPAIVGTDNATKRLESDQPVTLSCAEGDRGYVYEGALEFDVVEEDLTDLPDPGVQIQLNMASPAGAFRWWPLPVEGIGLARMEFIINDRIKIHPMALAHPERIEDSDVRATIERLTRHYEDKSEYFVDRLASGIAKIAASQYPDPVLVRMSDFKTNEYASLIGGEIFEFEEDNPMLGFRGASRYTHERYRDGFKLECRAIRRVREKIGLDNVRIMIPFCRTPEERDRVLDLLADQGLERGQNGLEIWLMAEIPSNVELAEAFADRVDGFSIGSNDLTQLVLGVDRDSSILSDLFDERNDAVTNSIARLIESAHQQDVPVSICGQAPSDYPEFAEFLVKQGIDSMSLNPDSVIEVIRHLGS